MDENDACRHLYEPVDRMEAISARVAEGDRDTLRTKSASQKMWPTKWQGMCGDFKWTSE